MRLTRRYRWSLFAVAVAIWPVREVFTWSRVFMLRDLTLYFWPKYLWLRETVKGGEWPWWDPYMGAGHSAAADALNQLFLLPTVALRLLLPAPVGFNIWVALPFPLAAWGAYLYFRRYASPAAAALGSIAFAVSGPIVSTGNFPNLSWSVLFIPWVLWLVDRCAESLSPRRIAALAVCVAAQCCAGEPVTLVATAALAVAYAAVAAPIRGARVRDRLAFVGATLLALVGGAALAAVQLLPLWLATRASVRAGIVANGSFWSTHPLTLLETISPKLFGDYAVTFLAYQPWLKTLNSNRDPFFPSLYLGMGLALLALVGLTKGNRRRFALFWFGAGAVALIGAIGMYTPIYPAAQRFLPLVGSFRYPAKFLVFVSMALAAFVVLGWSVLERLRSGDAAEAVGLTRTRRAVAAIGLSVAVAAYVGAVLIFVWPDTAAMGLYHLARFLTISQAAHAVELLMPELPAHTSRLLLIALGTAGLLWVALSARREARLAQWVFYAVIVVDLAVTNGAANPTVHMDLLRTPAWTEVVERHPHERFYFGGRLWGGIQDADPESPASVTLPPVQDLQEVRVVTSSQMLITPSMAGLREMMSFDLASLWPREYTRVHAIFAERATREGRLLLLRRGGVRYCFMREPLPVPDAPVLARAPDLHGVALFECNPDAARAVVVDEARIVPSSEEQAQKLFKPEGGDDLLMLKIQPPSPAGAVGTPASPAATFVRDDATVVELHASAGANGGYLLLRDSYHPAWQAEVDGRPAEILRANLLFRAVRLAPGQHTVRFTLVPTPVYYGAAISGVAALGLLLMACWPVRGHRLPAHDPAGRILVHTDEPVMPA